MLEPSAPDRRGRSQEHEKQSVHPAEVELRPVAVGSEQRMPGDRELAREACRVAGAGDRLGHAIGDRDVLKFNPDGAVDLYFENQSPGKDKESNWLPAPKGPFMMAMRLYWPKAEAVEGKWTAPPLKKAE